MTRWVKLKKKGWPDWLYLSRGKSGSSYWIRFRREGLKVEERIEAPEGKWLVAKKRGQAILDRARVSKETLNLPAKLIRTETVCHEVVALRKGNAIETYKGTEKAMRLHLIPWFNIHAPHVADLEDVTLWEKYRAMVRTRNPREPLFSHRKFFLMTTNYCFRKGLIKKQIEIPFDEKKDDFRQRGMVIPDEDFELFAQFARSDWHDRAVIQRFTGMRPGEVRCLHRSRIEFVKPGAVKISLSAEDTKTRTKREFMVFSERVIEILRRRTSGENGFLFQGRPSKGDAHIGKTMTGWWNGMKRAGLEHKGYTPHDLRHTFLTKEFKRPGARHAVICYSAGISIEEAQKTYLHFTAEDTTEMAEEIAKDSVLMLRQVRA